jgi:hypothetical protein
VEGLEGNVGGLILKSSYALQCVSAVCYNSVLSLQEIAHTLFELHDLTEQDGLYQQWRRKYQELVDEGYPDAKARS